MDRLFQMLEGVPVVGQDQIDYLIDHASRVDKLSFQVVTLLLGICAILAATTRLVFRYRDENKFNLDDWLVLFATIFLIAETGVLYSFIHMLYVIDAATTHLTVLAHISRDPVLTEKLLYNGPSTLVAYVTLGWAVIFAIKFSFLALFHRLLRNVSRKLTAYFWCIVAATGMSGVVVILESFILCPHFGKSSAQCFMKNNYTFSISSGVVVQMLDIVTDLLVISIPIILLRMSHLRLQHKLRIAVVVCLSGICIILSIVRLTAGLRRNVFGKKQFGVTWISFMLHCEAAIAVMAGTVPALRAVYTSRQGRQTRKSITQLKEEPSQVATTKTLKSKASTLFKWGEKRKSVLPLQERDWVSRPSMAKWRQSIVGFIPKRVATIGSRSTNTPTFVTEARKGSADSAIIHPGLAYHAFRRQESMNQLNQIRVTHETTIHTVSHDKTWDLGESMSHSGTIVSAPNSPTMDDFPYPDPVLSTTKGMDFLVDQQFGKISAGMHI